MSVKPVREADIKAPVSDKLAWGAAMFLYGQKLSLSLATENPGPACPVNVVLTGIDEVSGKSKSNFQFSGRFADDEVTIHNLAILGLPEKASFEGTIDFTHEAGKLHTKMAH
jgi:hypothetical protein